MSSILGEADWRKWQTLLEQFDMHSFINEQDTRVVTATDTVTDTLTIFTRHNIHSAPVFDPAQGSFIGMIDMLDLVAFLCRFSGSLGGTKRLERTELNYEKIKQNLDAMSDEQRANANNTPVHALIGLSERTSWSPISVETPAQTIIKLLAERNVHRLPVVTEEGDRFLGVITQIDLVRWLHAHRDELPESLKRLKVRDSRLGGVEMVTVASNATVIEALILMDEKKVSALPIVDLDGHLRGNISATDISRLGISPSDKAHDLLQKLFIPVASFHTEPVVTCTMDTPIAEILAAVNFNRVHRLWVVDNNTKPISVISLGDVLTHFVPPAEGYVS